MWCVGCVMYELCTQKMLAEQEFVLGKELAKDPSFVQRMLEEIPGRYSKSLRSMIKRLLSLDPKRRPRAEELLKKNKVRRCHKLSPYKLEKEKSEAVLEISANKNESTDA